MSKVLIASIGKGAKDPVSGKPRYNKLRYYDGKDMNNTVETYYIIEAIKHFYNIDKLILVGTCGSDWASFYSYIYDPSCNICKPAKPYNAQYEAELRQSTADNAVLTDTKSMCGKLSGLSDALGDFCAGICILRYGMNDDELLENFNLFSEIGKYLHSTDSVVFDITHSFRSLPVYEIVALRYFNDVLNLNITIDAVTYGMSEGMNGPTPIVNLKKLVSMFDYIKAIDEYKKFGTTYALCEIIPTLSKIEFSKNSRKAFEMLNDSAESNDIFSFADMVRTCHKVVNTPVSSYPTEFRMIADVICADIDKRFYDSVSDTFELRIQLANWHLDNKRYTACSVILGEAILDFCGDVCGYDIAYKNQNEEFRLKMQNAYAADADTGNFISHYNKRLRLIRNNFAHNIMFDNNGDKIDYSNEIKELCDLSEYFLITYRKCYKNNAASCDKLRAAIMK